ncbi:hypothetical protein N7486_006748 [Penicillium sp. IBT 16267x]|nr:hypothetical protein N7486_006748 [Penicillium sp. IBT 16267x]
MLEEQGRNHEAQYELGDHQVGLRWKAEPCLAHYQIWIAWTRRSGETESLVALYARGPRRRGPLVPNCQVSQGSKASLEREAAQHLVVTANIQPFERWGIDLIGRLPLTPNGNCWIITAIDYATGWPVARAVPDATEETLARFLHDDIFVPHGAPKELLSDNGPNLLSGAIEARSPYFGIDSRVAEW